MATSKPPNARAGSPQSVAEPPRLAKNAAGLSQVLAQSFLGNGPLASATVFITGAAAFGLGSLPLVLVFGALIIMLWINTPYQFSRHVQVAGGLYSMTKTGIDKRVGFATTWAYLFGYMTVNVAYALFSFAVLQAVLAVFGIALATWTWVPIALVALIGPQILTLLRVHPSLQYGVVTAALELSVLVVFSLFLIFHSGTHNTGRVFGPSYAINGWHGVVIGAFIASNSLAGCESAIGLGEEAKLPQQNIKRALLISQSSIIAVFILVAYSFTVAWGPSKMSTFAASGAPIITLLQSVWGKTGIIVVALLIFNSIYGTNVGCSMFSGRMLLDMARGGHTPPWLTRVHPKFETPQMALLTVLALQITMAIIAGVIWGPITGGLVVIVGSTAGLFVGQFGADTALTLFGWARKFNPVFYILIPVLAVLSILVGGWANFFPVTFPTVWGPIFMLVILLLALVWAFAGRKQSSEPSLDLGEPTTITERTEISPEGTV